MKSSPFVKCFIIAYSFIVIISCKKVIKSDLNSVCIDSCTIVQGRFITGKDIGVSDIPYEIFSESQPTLGIGQTTTRKIASGKSDQKGSIYAKFKLRNNEYGPSAPAYVKLRFDYDKTRYLPITAYTYYGAIEYIGPFSRKDTTVNTNIYLASRSKLRIRLENFVPIVTGDEFSVLTMCGAGLNRKEESGDIIIAKGTITEKEVDVCGDEQTTVVVRKKKNGISSTTSITFLTPINQTMSISYSY